MSDFNNPSYETMIKRLQKIYQQSVENKTAIVDRQPDNSKIYLENNWLKNVGQIDDTGDQPVATVSYSTLVPNITSYITSFIPISGNITPGPYPATTRFDYDDVLPNVTKDIIPFLEFETSFTSAQPLYAGYVFNGIDAYLSTFEVDANGTTIWTGENPPIGSQIEISQIQNDNGYAAYTEPAYHLSFTSSTGGIYGHGSLVGVVILSVYDETSMTFLAIDDNLTSFPPDASHQYTFYVWSNAFQLNFALQYSLMNADSVVIFREEDAYIAFWADPIANPPQVPFYFFEDVLSGGLIDFYVFPPGSGMSTSPLNPVTVFINQDGPVKYSDIAGDTVTNFVSSSQTYDPFFFRQSQSTDATEVWQGILSFGAVMVADGVSDDIEFVVYNDTYNWEQVDSQYQWVRTPDHSTITKQQYFAPGNDMTARVKVVCRPPRNWKESKKFQY